MVHETYFLGMHLIWWALWFILFTGFLAYRFDMLGKRSKKKIQLDLLEKRYTAGDISSAEYNMRKETFADPMPALRSEHSRQPIPFMFKINNQALH